MPGGGVPTLQAVHEYGVLSGRQSLHGDGCPAPALRSVVNREQHTFPVRKGIGQPVADFSVRSVE